MSGLLATQSTLDTEMFGARNSVVQPLVNGKLSTGFLHLGNQLAFQFKYQVRATEGSRMTTRIFVAVAAKILHPLTTKNQAKVSNARFAQFYPQSLENHFFIPFWETLTLSGIYLLTSDYNNMFSTTPLLSIYPPFFVDRDRDKWY